MQDPPLFTLATSVPSVHLEGTTLGLVWSLPFVGLLLSIALVPLIAPRFWEEHFGKIVSAWALVFLLPYAIVFGMSTAVTETLHMLLLDYFPFILMLFALFVVAGGIRITGNLVGTPATNTALLAFGTLSASLFGSIGASMLLVRPLLQANKDRQHNVHVFVFFIFLVCNIGGSLTPLGNPPLFLGFLRGVDFLWTLETMLRPMLLVSGILLALFYVIDRLAWNKEPGEVKGKRGVPRQVRIEGLHNVLYLAGDRRRGAGERAMGWRRHDPDRLGEQAAGRWIGARRHTSRAHLPLLENYTQLDPYRKRLLLEAVPGGGNSLRRHLHHDDPTLGDASRQSRGSVRTAP